MNNAIIQYNKNSLEYSVVHSTMAPITA